MHEELIPLENALPSKNILVPVRVKLIGVLASAANTRQIDLNLTGVVTVSDLISKLLETVGKPRFEEFLVDSGTRDPRPNVIILLGEQDCNLLGGLRATISHNSTVTLIPVAHGG